LTLPQDGSCPDKRCPYYTRISEPIEVEDSPGNLQGWAESLIEAGKIGLRYHQAFEAMATAFEELAGEHRTLLDWYEDTALERDGLLKALDPEAITANEDEVVCRAYKRHKPRRRATPTTEIPPAVSESQAMPQGQGEARNADGTPYIAAAESGMTGAAQPECETVPTSDDMVTGSPAVCRWEIGRWGICS